MAALFQTGLRLLPSRAQSFWLMRLKSLWLEWAGHTPYVFPTGTESFRQSPGVTASPWPLSFNRDADAALQLCASRLPAGAGAEPGEPCCTEMGHSGTAQAVMAGLGGEVNRWAGAVRLKGDGGL